MGLAFLTTIFFSLSAVSGNRAASFIGGTRANLSRLTFAAFLLGIWSHFFGWGLTGKGLPILFLSGCIGFGVGDLALFQALPRIGSRLSVLMVLCLSTPIATVIEWLRLGSTLSMPQAVCGVLILIGVAVALVPGHHLQVSRRDLNIGLSFGCLAACGQAIGAELSREAYALARTVGEDIDGISAAYQRVVGGLVVTALFWVAMRSRSNRADRFLFRSRAML